MKPELFNSLKGYKAKYLINDLMSGLLVAIIALPLSIALGLQSVPININANGIQMGIITAIVAGFFISALGGSRFQIGGPTAAFVVILYNYLNNPEIGLMGLQMATIFAGVYLIILGLCKCGSVIKYIPFPIVIGFTTGIGITLFVGQLKDFCGFTAQGSDFLEKIISYAQNIATFKLPTFLLGAFALIIIIGLQKINKKIPGAFISIIICTGISALIGDKFNIETIGSKYGEINASFNFIDFSAITSVNYSKIIMPSIVIAFLGALESLLSATVADGMVKTKHNPNQELLGQGVANIASSLCGGLPATGAIARTSANINSGAKSSLAGIFHAVFVLIMYFALMGAVKFIPLCVLAAILINVAINICNFKLFFKLSRFGIRDDIVLFATCLITVFFDLTYGVIGGIILSLIVNAKNIKLGLKIIKENEVINLKGSLYFISVNKLISYLSKEFESQNQLIVDMKDVNRIDVTSIDRLSILSAKLKTQGKSLEFINCNLKVHKRLKNI